MSYQILIAEDDQDIVELLALYLQSESFKVYVAADGLEAMEIIKKEKIDLLLIDIMMPKMNGYDTIKQLRENNQLPIIVLSAKSMDQDKILGLGLGADMYMTKPFNPLEVVANIKALLRRAYHFNDSINKEQKDGLLQAGEFTYDPQKLILRKNGDIIPLTACELKIFLKLLSAPGRVFTKGQLYEAIGNDFYESDDDTMMVHISKIRSKIENNPSFPRYIKTIRGLGYKFEYEDS